MKIIKIVLVLILGAAAAYLLIPKSQGDIPVIKESDPATLTPLSGDVSVLKRNETDWDKTEVESEIFDQWQVKTSNIGRALISKDEDILTTIDSSSVVTYSSPDKSKGSNFSIESGKVWSHVNRKLEQDEVYEVYTPTMVAAVRGTSFGVVVSETEDKLLVSEGTVQVSQKDPETGEPIEGTEVLVEENEKVTFKEGGLVVGEITEEEKGGWFEFNSAKNPIKEEEETDEEIPVKKPEIQTDIITQEPIAETETAVETEPITETEQTVIETETSTSTKEESAEATSTASTVNVDENTVTPLLILSASPNVLGLDSTETLIIKGSGFTGLESFGMNEQEVIPEIIDDSTIHILPSQLSKLEPNTYTITVYSNGISHFLADAVQIR